jgi:hypothetical protein
MRYAMIAGLAIVLATGASTPGHAQDPSARCVWVGNRQMTIASAQGQGLDIQTFSEVETATFLKAFNAMAPESHFIATGMFAAVGDDRAYVFFESGEDLCTPPSPLSRASYEALVKQTQGEGS